MMQNSFYKLDFLFVKNEEILYIIMPNVQNIADIQTILETVSFKKIIDKNTTETGTNAIIVAAPVAPKIWIE